MPTRKVKTTDDSSSRSSMPALTPEARENQMIALAVDVAEQQLRKGTASSAVIVHYLKLGTVKSQVELEKLKRENELLEAKTKSLESAQHSEELYRQAIKAMGIYSGKESDEDDEQED
jgi:hypothetical protein